MELCTYRGDVDYIIVKQYFTSRILQHIPYQIKINELLEQPKFILLFLWFYSSYLLYDYKYFI